MNIEDAILHWVPVDDGKSLPRLSEKKSYKITDDFWTAKITESLDNKYARTIEDIPSTPSTVVQNIRLLATCRSDADFIKYSYIITDLLHKAQSKTQISDGFLVFFKGSVQNRNFVCLLKLEGMKGSEANFDQSRKSFEILPLESILLTDKSRVFKMAYFEFHNGSLLRAKAMDDQINRDEISHFWLVKFLGCRFPEKPEKLTRDFFEFVQSFSRNKNLTPSQALNVNMALYVEMNSQSKTLSVADFGKNHIPAELLPVYNKAAQKAKVPLYSFQKVFDPNLKKQIAVRKFLLEEDIKVFVPQAVLDSQRLAKFRAEKGQQRLEISAIVRREIT